MLEPAGIKDVNGNEIREGDMIELNPKYNYTDIKKVRFIVQIKDGKINFPRFDSLPDAYRILGNIHSFAYPELKEKDKCLLLP